VCKLVRERVGVGCEHRGIDEIALAEPIVARFLVLERVDFCVIAQSKQGVVAPIMASAEEGSRFGH
jgi:hypothetical protein